MAIQGTVVINDNNGTTFETVEDWIATHGSCGSKVEGTVSGELTLNANKTSVTRTIVWEDNAARETWKANRAGPADATRGWTEDKSTRTETTV